MEIYKKKIAARGEAFYTTLAKGLEHVRNEFYAFHVEPAKAYKVIGDTYMEHEKCGLKEITLWRLVPVHCTMRKHGIYKELVKSL